MAAIASTGVAFAAAPSSSAPSNNRDTTTISPATLPEEDPSVRSDGGEVVLDSIESAIESVRRGEFVVVVDDLDRENEGDLVCAASEVTQQMMAWLIRHSSYVNNPPPLYFFRFVSR